MVSLDGASLVAQRVKHLLAMRETWVRFLGSGRCPAEENGNPLPVLLPGKPHGQRSRVGHSPWGREDSDTTGRPSLPFPSLPVPSLDGHTEKS